MITGAGLAPLGPIDGISYLCKVAGFGDNAGIRGHASLSRRSTGGSASGGADIGGALEHGRGHC